MRRCHDNIIVPCRHQINVQDRDVQSICPGQNRALRRRNPHAMRNPLHCERLRCVRSLHILTSKPVAICKFHIPSCFPSCCIFLFCHHCKTAEPESLALPLRRLYLQYAVLLHLQLAAVISLRRQSHASPFRSAHRLHPCRLFLRYKTALPRRMPG